MNEQQKRYLKLNGDPVHMDFVEAIKTLPEYKTAGLTAVFNLCALGASSPDAILITAGSSLVGVVAAQKIAEAYQFLQLRSSFGKNYQNLAIDKAPDHKTPPTSPRHIDASAQVRNSSAFATVVTGNKMLIVGMVGCMGLLGELRSLPQDAMVPLQLGWTFLGSLSSYLCIRFGRATVNHHKVVKQDYAITNMPKPQKQEEKISVAAPQLT